MLPSYICLCCCVAFVGVGFPAEPLAMQALPYYQCSVCRSVSRSTTQPEKPTENHLTYLDKFLQNRRDTEEYVRPSFLLSPLVRVKTPRVRFCGEEGFQAGVPTSSSRALQHQRGWSTRLLLTVSPGDTPFSCKARPGGWPYHGQDGYASPPKITHGTGATPTPGQL